MHRKPWQRSTETPPWAGRVAGGAAVSTAALRYERLLRRLGSLRPKDSRRGRKAARGAVGDLDLIFPRQTEGAGHHVLHEAVGTIHRAALHRDVTAVPELVDVVLDAPVDPSFAHQVGPHLGGDDLVGPPCGAVGDDAAVEIDDHALAHGIARTVLSAHADSSRHHQVLERFGLAGEAPTLEDRRGLAGGADHDLGALVGAFARHLREHAVVADDQREPGALRSVDHGNADVAGLPWLDRNPRVKLSVVQLDLAG